jgi:cell division protein FtsL
MQSRAQNKNKILKSYNVRIFLLIMLFVVCSAYVWQINSVATQGYYLKDLDKKLEILEKRNDHLQVEATQLKSLSRVEEEVKNLGLVKIDTVHYLTVVDSSVAFKR